ncbi:MAG TPA: hypothetical protein VGS19_25885 [Streptosporangiaceae bacterium]|nr:hypothetical protein [Streptosporangiaceae bacterium]
MSTAQYRILAPAGEERENGSGDIDVVQGALVLTPSTGAALRVPFGQIASVTEPEQFTVRVTLADGNAVELSRLGVMRTQLIAELRDGLGDEAASASGAVGEAAVFPCSYGGEWAEVHVFEDALLLISATGSERFSFSFAGAVETRDYAVTVAVAGREPVVLSQLGRRCGELAGLLTDRLREARGRTSAFLASLLPGLGPMALREAAGLLRDGVAVPASTLDAIHPDLTGTLLQVAALPARRDAVTDLGRRTELAVGFKQVVSVRRAAVGVTPWHDHSVTPDFYGHESPGGTFRSGPMGMMAASVMSAGPGRLFGFGDGYGMYGGYWAFRALGAGMNWAEQRPMTARPDMTRGLLTPETEDLAALTTAGDSPTVLAFALGSHPGRVVYEVLNKPEPMTWVFRVDGPNGLTTVNRALDDAGFQVAASASLAAQPQPTGAAQLLASSLAGQVPHDAQWPARIAELLAD